MTSEREERVGVVLKIGSVLSTALLAVGVIACLLAPASEVARLSIHGGLLLIMATPVVRVVMSMVDFAQQQEWLFVLMTIAVLGVLAASVVAAFG